MGVACNRTLAQALQTNRKEAACSLHRNVLPCMKYSCIPIVLQDLLKVWREDNQNNKLLRDRHEKVRHD